MTYETPSSAVPALRERFDAIVNKTEVRGWASLTAEESCLYLMIRKTLANLAQGVRTLDFDELERILRKDHDDEWAAKPAEWDTALASAKVEMQGLLEFHSDSNLHN